MHVFVLLAEEDGSEAVDILEHVDVTNWFCDTCARPNDVVITGVELKSRSRVF